MLDGLLTCAAVGGPETVARDVAAFIARTQPDELIVAAQIFDHAARLRSFEIAAAVRDRLAAAPVVG